MPIAEPAYREVIDLIFKAPVSTREHELASSILALSEPNGAERMGKDLLNSQDGLRFAAGIAIVGIGKVAYQFKRPVIGLNIYKLNREIGISRAGSIILGSIPVGLGTAQAVAKKYRRENKKLELVA